MFSNKLTDLDDFLKPNLECIKPLIPGAKLDLSMSGAVDSKLTSSDEQTSSIRPNLIKSSVDKIAAVTLQDCLACSGCVTSAETVLI